MHPLHLNLSPSINIKIQFYSFKVFIFSKFLKLSNNLKISKSEKFLKFLNLKNFKKFQISKVAKLIKKHFRYLKKKP